MIGTSDGQQFEHEADYALNYKKPKLEVQDPSVDTFDQRWNALDPINQLIDKTKGVIPDKDIPGRKFAMADENLSISENIEDRRNKETTLKDILQTVHGIAQGGFKEGDNLLGLNTNANYGTLPSQAGLGDIPNKNIVEQILGLRKYLGPDPEHDDPVAVENRLKYKKELKNIRENVKYNKEWYDEWTGDLRRKMEQRHVP